MTWIPNARTKDFEPIPGVLWREYTDEEFAALEAAYDAQHSADQSGSLRAWFDHIPADDAAKPRVARRAAVAAEEGSR